MEPLTVVDAREPVIVQCEYDRDAAPLRDSRVVHRVVQQMMQVHDVRPLVVEDLLEAVVHARVEIGFGERGMLVVVHDLVAGQGAEYVPPVAVLRAREIELGEEGVHRVLPFGKCPRQVIAVQLRARDVLWHEIMNDLEDSHRGRRCAWISTSTSHGRSARARPHDPQPS